MFSNIFVGRSGSDFIKIGNTSSSKDLNEPVTVVIRICCGAARVGHAGALATCGVGEADRGFAGRGIRGLGLQAVEQIVVEGGGATVEVGLAREIAHRVIAHGLGHAERKRAAGTPAARFTPDADGGRPGKSGRPKTREPKGLNHA